MDGSKIGWHAHEAVTCALASSSALDWTIYNSNSHTYITHIYSLREWRMQWWWMMTTYNDDIQWASVHTSPLSQPIGRFQSNATVGPFNDSARLILNSFYISWLLSWLFQRRVRYNSELAAISMNHTSGSIYHIRPWGRSCGHNGAWSRVSSSRHPNIMVVWY